jgi:hypothetical protein
MVYLYFEFALQVRRVRAFQTGVRGLVLIMVYVYYEFLLQGIRFSIV